MATTFQLITILVIGTFATAEDTESSLLEILRVPDASSVPINFGLPKEEAPEPFHSQELPKESIFEVPQNYFTPDANYEYQIPSQDLQLPSIEPWNPDNDPKFYYQLPVVVTKQGQPTNVYPKKYNEDIYEKEKPFASRPKQEISLIPIPKEQFLNKQKDANKVLLNMAKVQNQKAIEAEKVQSLKYLTKSKQVDSKSINEPESAATGFGAGFTADGVFGQTNSDLLSSSELHQSSPYRHHFHMHGHNGPHTYKWGYDTGKGHNRQFRFEERDKHGHVKGHYGFFDKHGKLQMIHYNAHPHLGFNIDESI